MFRALILIISLLCCSCNLKDNNIRNIPYTVVIFDNTPDHTSTKRGVGHMTSLPICIFNYVDEEFVVQTYLPSMIGYDTLRIPSHGDYVEVMHRNQAIEDNYYLLKAGDTVLFSYTDNLRPHIQSVTSSDNTWLYTIPEHDQRWVHQPTGYNVKTICGDKVYGAMWFALNNSRYKNDNSKQQTLKRYKKICPNIDSIKNVYIDYKKDHLLYIDSLSKMGELSEPYIDYYKNYGSKRFSIAQVLHSDSLLRYPSSHDIIKGVLMDADSLGIIDFCRDDKISIIARKSVIYYMLKLANEDPTAFTRQVYSACSAMYNELNGYKFETENISPDLVVTTEHSLILEDIHGARTTLEEVVKKHPEKAIYVELWATWCSPCRSNMPIAESLRRAYHNKDVKFVYIALDDNTEAWKYNVEQLNMESYNGINYRAINYKESIFLKEINHRFIPHYILYNKGFIVDSNAPSPQTIGKTIDNILDTLAKAEKIENPEKSR